LKSEGTGFEISDKVSLVNIINYLINETSQDFKLKDKINLFLSSRRGGTEKIMRSMNLINQQSKLPLSTQTHKLLNP
jgi:hypothetical protein